MRRDEPPTTDEFSTSKIKITLRISESNFYINRKKTHTGYTENEIGVLFSQVLRTDIVIFCCGEKRTGIES